MNAALCRLKQSGQPAFAAVLAAAVLVSCSGQKGEDMNQHNPYKYDIEQYKAVDPSLLHYRVLKQTKFPAGVARSLSRTQGRAVSDANGRSRTQAGELLVLLGSELVFLNQDLERTHAIGVAADARSAASHDGETIYVNLGNAIAIIDRSGTELGRWSSFGRNTSLISLAVDAAQVVATDQGEKMVWRFDHTGKLLDIIRSDASPNGFVIPSPCFPAALDPDGSLWVGHTGERRVEHYSSEGKLIGYFGASGMAVGRFSGCCNPASLAVLGESLIATGEKGLPRITVFDTRGSLQSMVAAPKDFPDGARLHLAAAENGDLCVLETVSGELRIYRKTTDKS